MLAPSQLVSVCSQKRRGHSPRGSAAKTVPVSPRKVLAPREDVPPGVHLVSARRCPAPQGFTVVPPELLPDHRPLCRGAAPRLFPLLPSASQPSSTCGKTENFCFG